MAVLDLCPEYSETVAVSEGPLNSLTQALSDPQRPLIMRSTMSYVRNALSMKVETLTHLALAPYSDNNNNNITQGQAATAARLCC